MPNGYTTNFVVSIAGSLLLALGILAGTAAEAAPVDPDAQLPGISPAGWQSFTFNDNNDGFSNNIASWFSNYLIVQRTGDDYTMYAHGEGAFKFWTAPAWDSSDSYLQGRSGTQDLIANFDANGNLVGGSVTVTGAIPDLGIDSPVTLMTANLIPDGSVAGKEGFAFNGDLLGFSIEMTYCADEIICSNSLESIYYSIEGDFPGFEALTEGSIYRTTMATKTTVPVPASAWFMVSGLILLGGRAKLRPV